MKRLLVWYHRRRAAYHEAMALNPGSLLHRCYQWHQVWAKWHSIQVEILTNENNNT